MAESVPVGMIVVGAFDVDVDVRLADTEDGVSVLVGAYVKVTGLLDGVVADPLEVLLMIDTFDGFVVVSEVLESVT